MSSTSDKTLPPSDEKNNSKDEVKSSTKPESGSGGLPAFDLKNFDFSGMAGYLNDPSIKALTENIAKDPAFNQLADQLQRSVPTASREAGPLPNFDLELYVNTIHQMMKNLEFRTISERLGKAFVQDPQISPFLEALRNRGSTEQSAERTAQMKEDTELKSLLAEIEAAHLSAVMKYWNDKDVLKKPDEAMGIAVGAEPSVSAKAEEPEEGGEEESILHQAASLGDVEYFPKHG